MLKEKYEANQYLLPFYHANLLEKRCGFNLSFSYLLKNVCSNEIIFFVQKVQELINSQAHLKQTFSIENNKLIAHIHDTLPAHYTKAR